MAAQRPKTAIVNEPFTGHDRMMAKEDNPLVPAAVENFGDLTNLLNTLPTDADMQKLHITKTSGRVGPENRNVSVQSCWIVAVKHESDNDFHTILAETSTGGPFLNAEVCGTPTSGPAKALLQQVRGAFVDLLGLTSVNETYAAGFVKTVPPLHVQVSGALFYDVDHTVGVVGPSGEKPTTAWEIHPITAVRQAH